MGHPTMQENDTAKLTPTKKFWKSVNNIVLDRFCFLAVPTFLYSSLYGYLGDILEKMNLIENLHPIVEIVIFLFPIFVAIALPPNLWCLLRYKKDSVMAIKHHYRQSIWKDAIPMWLLWMIPFLFHLLLFAIYDVTTKKIN